MSFNEEQFVRDILGATGGKVIVEKGTLNKSFEEMKEDLDKVFKPRDPLFTLTAEEVDRFEKLLRNDYEIHQYGLFDLADTENREYHHKEMQEDLRIITRIKQWQNESN